MGWKRQWIYIRSIKPWLQENDIGISSTNDNESLLLLEDLLEL